MTTKRRNSRRLLATAVLVALAAPGMAFAQTAKEAELEARVAQLEAQVQRFLQGQQQERESITQAQARLEQGQVAHPAAKPLECKPVLAARKSTRLNSRHQSANRMPYSACN